MMGFLDSVNEKRILKAGVVINCAVKMFYSFFIPKQSVKKYMTLKDILVKIMYVINILDL